MSEIIGCYCYRTEDNYKEWSFGCGDTTITYFKCLDCESLMRFINNKFTLSKEHDDIMFSLEELEDIMAE